MLNENTGHTPPQGGLRRICKNCANSIDTLFPELITCTKAKGVAYRDINWVCALFRKKEDLK